MTTPGDCIVMDTGSGTVKAGFAGETEPRFTVKPVVGWTTDEDEPSTKNSFVGSDLKYAGEGVVMQRAVERGEVADWECAEVLWRHVIKAGLKVDPADHPAMVTEPALSPKASRERTAQIMMEGVGCAGVYLTVPGTLSLFASGRTSGVVLDIGYQQTTVVPVFQGYQLRPGTQMLPLGGSDLTMYLLNALVARGHPLTSSAYDDINTVKEKLCYVSDDFEMDLSDTLDNDRPAIRRDYTLPDGSTVTVDKELFMTPEILFKPTLIAQTFSGVNVATVEGVIRCDRHVHELLFDNVLLAGGATCTKQLKPRLYQEMLLVAPPMTKIRYIETKQHKRALSAWIGGAMLAKLDTFDDAYVRRWEYEEYGASIVHRKCF